MDFDINAILDLIYRYLGLALIIAVVVIIIVVLVIYKLIHSNINQTKSKYRTQKIVLAQIQQKEEELMYGEQSKKDKKLEIIKCQFCEGEITDNSALYCPLCGTML